MYYSYEVEDKSDDGKRVFPRKRTACDRKLYNRFFELSFQLPFSQDFGTGQVRGNNHFFRLYPCSVGTDADNKRRNNQKVGGGDDGKEPTGLSVGKMVDRKSQTLVLADSPLFRIGGGFTQSDKSFLQLFFRSTFIFIDFANIGFFYGFFPGSAAF